MNPDTVIAMEQARSPLRGSGLFARTDDEREFLRDEWAFVGSRLRSLGIWATGAFMLASVTDWIVLGSTPIFFGIFFLRFVVLGLGVNLVRASSAAQAPDPAALARTLVAFEATILLIFFWLRRPMAGRWSTTRSPHYSWCWRCTHMPRH